MPEKGTSRREATSWERVWGSPFLHGLFRGIEGSSKTRPLVFLCVEILFPCVNGNIVFPCVNDTKIGREIPAAGIPGGNSR